MKFYYNDKLIRTSKTHEYKFAAMLDGKCLKCSATREGAQAEITRSLNEQQSRIDFEKKILEAIERGETRVRAKNGPWVKLDPEWHTPENMLERIEKHKERMAYIREHAEVVELEARQ